jgi:hypothetical protein
MTPKPYAWRIQAQSRDARFVQEPRKAVTNIVSTGADMLTGDSFGNLYYKKNDSELWRYSY